MSASIVDYHLRQETPMWHFQSRMINDSLVHQNGATLRGSDVKPRLDKFLIRQMKCTEIDWERFRISNAHDALNYKIQIVAQGECKHNVDMGRKAFFGNSGSKNINNRIETVYYPDGIILKITCFIPELMDVIKEHLPGFFLIHNFGTRQDKGFGSFVVDKIDGNDVSTNPSVELKKYGETEGYTAYEIDLSECSDKKHILDNAYILYQWMKSGINFGKTYQKALLTTYMLKKNIYGEKRWMKERNIAPKVCRDKKIIKTEGNLKESKGEYRYIRAVLGVSGTQSWMTDKPGKYNRIEISVSSDDIARFQSPITIKYINHKVYFIAYDLSKKTFEKLFDKEFHFCNEKGKRESIKTPEGFDIEAFMDYCAEQCVQKGRIQTFFLMKNKYGYSLKKMTGGGEN